MKKAQQHTETWTWVPPGDRELPTEEQSVFVLKPLTQVERMKVWDNISWVIADHEGNRTIQPRAFQQAREIVLSNVVETRNFPAGEPVSWPTNGDRKAKEKYLEMMDDMQILLLGNEIREHSVYDEPANHERAGGDS